MKLLVRAMTGAFLCLCMLSSGLFAEDASVTRARLEFDRVQNLVTSGVLPMMRLQQAKDALDDARDEALLRESLFKMDVTVDQAQNLADIAARRLERDQRAYDERKKMVDGGIMARSEMDDIAAALDRARADRQWALKRVEFAKQMEQFARTEQEAMRHMDTLSATARMEHFVGSGDFKIESFEVIAKAFEKKFSHELPVSAMGETQVHKALGFDHRNRVDIALTPDQPEGQWLRQYLIARNIPFYAFRSAVPGKATGAHIHIGPPSSRYVAAKTSGTTARGGL